MSDEDQAIVDALVADCEAARRQGALITTRSFGSAGSCCALSAYSVGTLGAIAADSVVKACYAEDRATTLGLHTRSFTRGFDGVGLPTYGGSLAKLAPRSYAIGREVARRVFK